jgi:cob(I)alamin adenosyltransferase
MIAIDKFLIEAWYIDEVEKQALKWFRRNLFSLNSYVYLAGDTEKHVFPKECLDFMNRYIKEAGKEIGGAKDFIIWDNQYGVLIQELIVPAREMDVAFESIKNAGLIPSGDETRLIASIINRLSAWFFWMGRRIYKRLNIEENYWQGKIEAFPELYKD